MYLHAGAAQLRLVHIAELACFQVEQERHPAVSDGHKRLSRVTLLLQVHPSGTSLTQIEFHVCLIELPCLQVKFLKIAAG